VKVLFYGRLAEAIGTELELGVPPEASVADVRERLAGDYPHIGQLLRSARALTCVGDRLVRDDYRLVQHDTLEFLPPVSGG
jgi:molybdopterin converting factor small subunit